MSWQLVAGLLGLVYLLAGVTAWAVVHGGTRKKPPEPPDRRRPGP